MARSKSIDVRAVLRKVFPDRRLRTLARETGMVVRQRKVDPVALLWTVVLGFGAGRERSIAGLRRGYERATGQCLEESSFYKRFGEGFVTMLERALVHAREHGGSGGSCAGISRGLSTC